jgi:hypothetical protein
LKGIKNGDATSIAIISLPSGSAFNKGMERILYISPEKGINSTNITKTDNKILVNLLLSSNKCGTNVLLFWLF